MNKNKIDYLDISKGIGILFVVIGHAITKDIAAISIVWGIIRNIVYTVHMPLFFIIAGFLFKVNNEKYIRLGMKRFAIKKARLYLVPYFSMNCVAVIIFLILSNIKPLSNLISIPPSLSGGMIGVIRAIVLFEDFIDEHLWFAYVMFLLLLISFYISKLRIKNRKFYVIFLMLLVVLFMLSYYFPMPYLMKKTIRHMMFFQFGYNLDKIKKEVGISRVVICIAMVGYVILFGVYQYMFVNKEGLLLLEGMLLFAIGTTGSLLLFALSCFVSTRIKYLKIIFTKLNNYSYPIYLYHQPFLVGGIVVILRKLGVNTILTVGIATIVGIFIPVVVFKFIIQKNHILRLLFAGDR